MKRIKELEKIILTNTENYYNGKECISDEEFDALIEKLRSIDPYHKILHSVGWGYDISSAGGKEYKHLSYLSGIDNKPKVSKEFKLPISVKTPKLDGGSIELQYYKGTLMRCLTRGDGTYGIDRTDKLKYIVPKTLPISYTGSIVGEYVISSEDLEGFSDSISQRNIPNGFLSRDTVSEEDCKRFSFIAYKIGKTTTHKFTSRIKILEFIRSLGFTTVDYITGCIPYQEAIDRLKVIDNKTYLLDGIVSGCGTVLQYEDGTILYPEEIAFKTITSTAKPLVKEVNWNLTRTGKMVPTVITDTVTLSGANINRFLAHNAEYVKSQGIGVDARLEVTRSGEVIPYILEVLEPVESKLPEYCPACNSKLEWSGVHLVCNNPDCSGQSYSKVCQWIRVLASVDNLGGSLIGTLIEVLEIDSIPDLYKEHDLSILLNSEGIGYSKIKIVQSMFDRLNSDHSLEAYLMAMNLPGLGYRSASKICSGTSIYDEIKEDYYSDEFESQLLSLKGVNYPIKISLLKNWGRFLDLLKFVKISPKEVDTELELVEDTRIKVCITGKLDSMTKSEFYKSHNDSIVESSVKDCDYLISNTDSGSSKYKTATKLNKNIVTENEFIEILKNGSV